MEGRALNRQKFSPWAWLIPWWGSPLAHSVGDTVGAERATALAFGVAAGVLWQLLYRWDLVSRLTLMAVIVTVGLIIALLTGEEIRWDDMNSVGLYGIGVILALIYTEQYLRWRERHTASPAAAVNPPLEGA